MTTAKARVLCVDDDSDLLDINTSILRMAGHEVLEASSGNDCLRLAKEQKPDLILLDVILPDIFGYDLCRQIKKDPELFGTYVMLISGQETSSNCQIKGLEAGADGYIVRPVSGKELLARVQAMIRIKQTEVALRNSMERYQMLVETMNDGLGALDEKGLVTFVNNKLCEMLGRSKDEITGCSVSDFLDNESQKIFREQFVKNRKGIEESFELTCLKKDRQKVFTIVSPRAIVDEKGIFKGSFAVITDITGRRKAEEEIKRLNEELEKRVIQRTLQLEAVIKELENEIIQHKQTEEKLHNYAERLQALSKRLMEVQEAERRYIAQELHDEIGQALNGIKLAIDMIIKLPSENTETCLHEVQKNVQDILNRVHNISHDLRPSMLDDVGLFPTLSWHFDRFTTQTNIRVNFRHIGLRARFRPEIETAAYRIVQEAVTNVARHACVSEVTVLIVANKDTLVINIEDKGVGFDYSAVKAAGNTAGLKWMNERLAILGGSMKIESSAGTGTRLMATIPVKKIKLDEDEKF